MQISSAYFQVTEVTMKSNNDSTYQSISKVVWDQPIRKWKWQVKKVQPTWEFTMVTSFAPYSEAEEKKGQNVDCLKAVHH